MILRALGGTLLLLHGGVHALYSAHSGRLFELQAGLPWPEESWLFARLIGCDATRTLASIACLITAGGFATGGVAVLVRQSWWRPLVVGFAFFSAALFLLLWNGQVRSLDGQGAIAALMNMAIVAAALGFKRRRPARE